MRTLFVLYLLSLFGLALTAGCTSDDTPKDVVESDAEADKDIEATFDTASDLALDSGDEDLKRWTTPPLPPMAKRTRTSFRTQLHSTPR